MSSFRVDKKKSKLSTQEKSKTRFGKSNVNVIRSKLNLENVTLLSEKSIFLRTVWKEKSIPTVPPTTPKALNFENIYESIPTPLPDIEKLKLPYVRVIGVKKTLQILGDFLKCDKYNQNLLHFWFLDILTDCVWRTQDDFNLLESDQKIVLNWIIYIFNLIKGTLNNY